MKNYGNNLTASTQSGLENLWYPSDGKFRTKAATIKAIAVAEWILCQQGQDNKPDEQELFVAMHTCAYQATHPRPRKGMTCSRTRNLWVRRWERIREYIVESNLGLAYSTVSRFGNSRLDEDELLSEAMLGLLRAVDRFNPWKGYRFSTYACNVIARAIMRSGKRESNHHQRFPTQYDPSIDQPDQLPDLQSELYVERLVRALDRNLGELTDFESRILTQRYFQKGKTQTSFQEIGETVGLSKERVRQIQNVAFRKIRDALKEDSVLR